MGTAMRGLANLPVPEALHCLSRVTGVCEVGWGVENVRLRREERGTGLDEPFQ